MSDLEIKLLQAEKELRAIRADLNVLNSTTPKGTGGRTSALTFCSVRKNAVQNSSNRGKHSGLALVRIDRMESPESQFSNLADLDQFVFSR